MKELKDTSCSASPSASRRSVLAGLAALGITYAVPGIFQVNEAIARDDDRRGPGNGRRSKNSRRSKQSRRSKKSKSRKSRHSKNSRRSLASRRNRRSHASRKHNIGDMIRDNIGERR